MNTVEHFIERVKGNTELQAQIKQAGSVEAVVGIAHEFGYTFSAEHFQAVTESLSDDDLGNVAGGRFGKSLWS